MLSKIIKVFFAYRFMSPKTEILKPIKISENTNFYVKNIPTADAALYLFFL